jgi:hypothetical protein
MVRRSRLLILELPAGLAAHAADRRPEIRAGRGSSSGQVLGGVRFCNRTSAQLRGRQHLAALVQPGTGHDHQLRQHLQRLGQAGRRTRRNPTLLADLETTWLTAADGDINASNLLIDTDGKMWLVDWALSCRRPDPPGVPGLRVYQAA